MALHIELDFFRRERTGVPETVLAEYKTLEETYEIMKDLHERSGFALATRVPEKHFDALCDALPGCVANARARAVRMGIAHVTGAKIGVISAGTSDRSVAEEAAFCLESFGDTVLQ